MNNDISLVLLEQDLKARGLSPESTCVIATRPISRKTNLNIEVSSGFTNSRGLPRGQIGTFYRKAAAIVRAAIGEGLREAYIVNADNILCNHILLEARRHRFPVTLVVEGLMNFLDVELDTHSHSRRAARLLTARALKLRYEPPDGHLSGAYQPAVTRVATFANEGLRAPKAKQVLLPWPARPSTVEPSPSTALVVQTGLSNFMSETSYRNFTECYVDWIHSQGFQSVITKRHPRNYEPLLEQLLQPDMILDDERSLEEIIGTVDAGVIVGTGTTPLVTVKLMHPARRCVDFGADYYTVMSYGSGGGIGALFDAVGVEQVESGLELSGRHQ